ncbi:unnamed protein product [Bathycoccus prasinos]
MASRAAFTGDVWLSRLIVVGRISYGHNQKYNYDRFGCVENNTKSALSILQRMNISTARVRRDGLVKITTLWSHPAPPPPLPPPPPYVLFKWSCDI